MLRYSMTLLGFLLISVGWAQTLSAQTSVDPTGMVPGTSPSVDRSPNPGMPETREPGGIVFSGLRASCVRPGTILTIQGKNFDTMSHNNRLGLNNAGKLIELEILNKNKTRISSYLPKKNVEFNTSYDLVFYQKGNEYTFKQTGLSVRTCPANDITSNDRSVVQDVIILVEEAQVSPVRSELQRRGLPIVDVYSLNALQSVLIQTRASNAVTVIQELRVVFPDAEIDLNNDLTASAKPRLYAHKTLGWTSDSGCQNTQLGFPIGLLDGAIDQNHSAFADQSIVSRNFLGDQKIDLNHATSIASILIGNNQEQGYQGLIPGTNIYNAVVLRVSSSGDQLASTVAVLQGLDWLLSQQVRLINVSLSTATENRVLNKGFILSIEKGAIVFSSAGNQGPEAPESYPAALDGVFTVTAIDSRQKIYRDANQGDFIDFAAPGVDIWAATPDNKGAYVSGTSFATPHALAVASLILKNNSKISRQVLSRALSFSLTDLGVPGNDPVFGAGLLKVTC